MNHLRLADLAATLAVLACTAGNISAQSPAPGGYHLASTWKVGGEGGWDYLTFDSTAQRLYVTRTDRVQVIDAATGAVVGEVPGLDGGHGTALAPDLGRGFATSGRSGAVLVFDLQTLRPIGEPIAVGQKPDAIVYEPTSKHVFVFNGESHDASVIDAATAKVIATVALGGEPEFAVTARVHRVGMMNALVDSPLESMVFVNLSDQSKVVAIRAEENALLHHGDGWPLAPGENPTGLCVDPVHQHLFAGCRNQQMVDLTTRGKQIGAVPIGKGVDATAFDYNTGLAFASCGDGTLTVAREGSQGFQVVEVVKTQAGARTMALDPSTHAVYLATADFEPAPPPVPGQAGVRPKPVPGSFVVLKFVPGELR